MPGEHRVRTRNHMEVHEVVEPLWIEPLFSCGMARQNARIRTEHQDPTVGAID